ncbi:MAG: protein kinase, partial [Eubacterium sp.]|nr:protein kinase [Eubacterium sp.]
MNVKEYINSNYKLVKSLKRDGSVMIARCTIDDALYVVKNKKAYDSEIYKRLKEADIDGIPKVYEVLEEKDGLWVIEEFVQGRTLEEFFGDEYLADVTGDSGKAADDKATNSTATDGEGDSGKVADDKTSSGVASEDAAPGGAAAESELPDNVLEVSFDSTGINGIKTENDAAEWMLTNVIISVSKTLNKLHTLNPPIIHRDIKPENIIITDLAEIKLLDFNISRGFTGKADKDTVAMGTKGFAPPEQYGFKESDARSDIYSLGATIKYLMEKTHCKSEMLSEFIKKAMSFDPKDRFQNVIEVIYFIKHYDDDETEALLSQAGNAGLAG